MTASARKRLLTWGGVFALSILVRWLFLLAAYWLWKGELLSLTAFLPEYLAQAGDAPHYLRIAAVGYEAAGENANNVVFYPLYPLLIRLLTLTGLSAMAAALTVSNLCLGGAGLAVWLLLGEMSGGEGSTGAWTGWLLFLCYPFGMFLTGIYT